MFRKVVRLPIDLCLERLLDIKSANIYYIESGKQNIVSMDMSLHKITLTIITLLVKVNSNNKLGCHPLL